VTPPWDGRRWPASKIQDMARRADDLSNDTPIVVVNPDVDASVDALAAWIDELERDDDWIDLPITAAELLGEDRSARGS
jgi:hypothetical protein